MCGAAVQQPELLPSSSNRTCQDPEASPAIGAKMIVLMVGNGLDRAAGHAVGAKPL